ncbi:type II toxin-antitoxin system RelE/ParE family toxin (plasmid) [Acetobacteraceae bacterium]|nr:type II toxin-antitoxin system RelE/ParE family toxin [Acetobacteraceae bacterium]
MEIILEKRVEKWLQSLKDKQSFLAIIARLEQASKLVHLGDYKGLGNGLFEMRIHQGAGYRLYFICKGDVLIIILNGGTKQHQSADIKKANELAKEYKNDSRI